MKNYNAMVFKSDLHFYPEEMKNKIQLILRTEKEDMNFITSADAENMINIYNVFNTFSINELKGKYCRIFCDDNGKIDHINNIIFDLDNIIKNMEK